MSLKNVNAWLFAGVLAVGACSDSHSADKDDERDPIATDDDDGTASDSDDKPSTGGSSDQEGKKPSDVTPDAGSKAPLMDAGAVDGGKRDRPMPEAGPPMPIPPDPKRDGGAMMPMPPGPKHDGGEMPPPPPKRDGGPMPMPKPDKDPADAAAPDAAVP